MSIVTELEKLHALHQSGGITAEEFAAAKQALIRGSSDEAAVHFIDDTDAIPNSSSRFGNSSQSRKITIKTQSRLDRLEMRQSVVELDRESMIERDNYMVRGRYGNRYIPTIWGSLLSGIAFCAIGATSFAVTLFILTKTGSFELLSIVLVILAICGAGASIYDYIKAVDFKLAEERYKSDRRQLGGNTFTEFD